MTKDYIFTISIEITAENEDGERPDEMELAQEIIQKLSGQELLVSRPDGNWTLCRTGRSAGHELTGG